jgi:hypothetical protein
MAARKLSELLQSMGVETTVGGKLAQAGVKGMKWGVRKPRGSGPGPASKAAPPKPGKKFAKAPPKSAKKMTDQELKKVIARMQMEKQYAELSKPKVSAGKQMINNALKQYGQQQLNSFVAGVGNMAASAAKTGIQKQLAKQALTDPRTAAALGNILKSMKP